MPHVGSEIDAHFYRLIHGMLGTPRAEGELERRSENRRAYVATQRIAPWDGSRFPDPEQFVPVQCSDLTRGGFSFIAAEKPSFNALIVELGSPSHSLHVAAEVVRCVPVVRFSSGELKKVPSHDDPLAKVGPSGEHGVPLYLVGCRFTRRLRRPI